MINVARFSKKHEPFLHAAFGTGHIEMINTEVGKNGIVYLGLKTLKKPGEVGAFAYAGNSSLKDTEPQILFSFSNTKSIDALVSMLENCKLQLIKKQK